MSLEEQKDRFEEKVIHLTGLDFLDEAMIGSETVSRLDSLTEEESRDLLKAVYGYAQATQYCALYPELLKEDVTVARVYKDGIDLICKLVNVTQVRKKETA